MPREESEFPFLFVQLANYQKRFEQPTDSYWAQIREAQFGTLEVPRTGMALAIDVGEEKDIHPKNKHDVAARLVRWALVQDYGMKMAYRSPEFKSMSIAGNKATSASDVFGRSQRAVEVAGASGVARRGDG